MTHAQTVDFGKTAKDYAAYRAGFPDSFFEKLVTPAFTGQSGSVLDLGTGTGTLARGLALREFDVTGLDPAPDLLEAAQLLDQKAGTHIKYITAKAEDTGLPDESFDIITAGQCWHWVSQDDVLKEARRLLKENGKLIIAYFDWDHDCPPVMEMRKLRSKYNPDYTGQDWPLGFYPQKPEDLTFPGWVPEASFLYTENVPYTHEGWRGRIRAYAGIGGSLPPETVALFDTEFAAVLKKNCPEEPLQVPHKIWAGVWSLAQ